MLAITQMIKSERTRPIGKPFGQTVKLVPRQRAWQKQVKTAISTWSEHDVEVACLERLEEQMFERSALVGIAGHCQWRLDAGDHQDFWNPYEGIPDHWNHRDRESKSEGELQVSPPSIRDRFQLIGNLSLVRA